MEVSNHAFHNGQAMNRIEESIQAASTSAQTQQVAFDAAAHHQTAAIASLAEQIVGIDKFAKYQAERLRSRMDEKSDNLKERFEGKLKQTEMAVTKLSGRFEEGGSALAKREENQRSLSPTPPTSII